MLGTAVGVPSPRAGPREAALRRDHEPLGVRVERLGDLQLVDLRAVRVGGVDQGDAELDHATEDAQGVLRVRRRAPDSGTEELHRPEAEATDLEVADPHAPSAAYTTEYALTASFSFWAARSAVSSIRPATSSMKRHWSTLRLTSGDGVLGVRVEVHPEPLAVVSVPGAAQLERELERLHERGRPDHVVVVEGAPARVGVQVAEQPFRGEQRRVLGEVLPVHDQVLPVHVDLDVVDALDAQLVDDVERHPDVPHQDLHRRLRVLVLEEDVIPWLFARSAASPIPSTSQAHDSLYGVWNGWCSPRSRAR